MFRLCEISFLSAFMTLFFMTFDCMRLDKKVILNISTERPPQKKIWEICPFEVFKYYWPLSQSSGVVFPTPSSISWHQKHYHSRKHRHKCVLWRCRLVVASVYISTPKVKFQHMLPIISFTFPLHKSVWRHSTIPEGCWEIPTLM